MGELEPLGGRNIANLLQQAINCEDADRAARIIQEALGIKSDDVVNVASPNPGRLIGGSARASLASG